MLQLLVANHWLEENKEMKQSGSMSLWCTSTRIIYQSVGCGLCGNISTEEICDEQGWCQYCYLTCRWSCTLTAFEPHLLFPCWNRHAWNIWSAISRLLSNYSLLENRSFLMVFRPRESRETLRGYELIIQYPLYTNIKPDNQKSYFLTFVFSKCSRLQL